MVYATNLKRSGWIWTQPPDRKESRRTQAPTQDGTGHDTTCSSQFAQARKPERTNDSATHRDSQRRDTNRGRNVITIVTTVPVKIGYRDNPTTRHSIVDASSHHGLLGVLPVTKRKHPGKKQRIANKRAVDLKLKAAKREAKLNRAPKEGANRKIHRHSSSTTFKFCRGAFAGTDDYDVWEE